MNKQYKNTKYYINNFFFFYTFLFLIISLIGFAPFWSEKKLPIYYNDGVGQFYPAFLYIGRWIRTFLLNILNGNFQVPFFDLNIGMGEDIIGCLNYYGFGDPLNIFAIFATSKTGPYVFSFLYFFRLYLSGVSFYLYCKKMRLENKYVYIGVFAYVFSGFALSAGMRYIEMLSAMIYFPLILYGCEKIFEHGNVHLLAVSVAFSALCGFYFLYMISLYLVVYCIVRLFAKYWSNEHKQIIFMILRCIGGYLIGLCIASPIFITSVCAFLNSNRSNIDIFEVLLNAKNWIPSFELCKRFLLGFKNGTDFYYWYEVPILEFFLVGASLFFCKKSKKDMQCFLAAVIGAIAWSLPITSYVVSAFSCYWRWSFMLQFTYCIIMICTFNNIVEFLQNNLARKYIYYGLQILIILNICISVFCHNSESEEKSFDGIAWKEKFLTSQMVIDYAGSPAVLSKIIQDDQADYRISNSQLSELNGNPDNCGTANQYNGLTFWYSIINGNAQRYINHMNGKAVDRWRSFGLSNSAVLESLAGVKYSITNQNNAPIGYQKVESVLYNNDEWEVFKNNNYLPMMYCYNESISDDTFEDYNSVEKIVSQLQYAAIENDDKNANTSLQEMGAFNQIVELNGSIIKRDATSIELSYSIEEDSDVYILIEQNDVLKQVQCKIFGIGHSEEECSILNSRDFMLGFGGMYEGEEFILRIMEADNVDENVILQYVHVLCIPKQLIEDNLRILGEDQIDVSMGVNSFCGNVDIDKDKIVVLAVPYSSNWKMFVDGKETEIQKINGIYMGARIEEGKHEILFQYRPVGVYIGCVISILSIIGLIITKKGNRLWNRNSMY